MLTKFLRISHVHNNSTVVRNNENLNYPLKNFTRVVNEKTNLLIKSIYTLSEIQVVKLQKVVRKKKLQI